MNLINKIKVRLRPSNPVKIEVREKEIFTCHSCHNHYNDFHCFCPQCLGEVTPNQPKPRSLKIVALNGIADELAAVLKVLTGKSEFDFSKALKSVPWIFIEDTDVAILKHWKEVLEAHRATFVLEERIKKRRRGPSAVFVSAPPPYFLNPSLSASARQAVGTIKDASIRLHWVEITLRVFHRMERFFKGEPSDRIVFSDFVFQTEQGLQDCVR
ncbi:MAG: hypothetical protein C5B54_08660, partial [Acidobacteria bacterium]